MITKKVNYEDFDGVMVEETLYFHLSKTDLLELETSKKGGYSSLLQGMLDKQKNGDEDAGINMMEVFKKILLKAYGFKSSNGKFIKTEEATLEFKHSPAFDQIFMDLFSEASDTTEFLIGMFPSEMASEARKEVAKQQLKGTVTKPEPITPEVIDSPKPSTRKRK